MTSRAAAGASVLQERKQLLMIAAGLAAASGLSFWWRGGRTSSAILLALAVVALTGGAAYRRCGRGVFLGFTLPVRAVGWVVSKLALVLMYAIVVLGIGGLVRFLGVNRLKRDFSECRKRPTMLEDVPPMNAAGFRRQS